MIYFAPAPTAGALPWRRKKARAKRKSDAVPPKLSDTEQDLLSQIEHGYQLETDSLGSNLVLRRLKDGELIRPANANAGTVKALQQQGLIRAAKGHDPLTIAWHLNKTR